MLDSGFTGRLNIVCEKKELVLEYRNYVKVEKNSGMVDFRRGLCETLKSFNIYF